MTEFFPPSFLNPDALQDVIAWIQALPIEPEDKKRVLLDWASRVGVSLTGEDVLAAIPELREIEGRA